MEQNHAANERNYALDVIRIVATTLIVFHHYQQFTGLRLEHFDFYYQDRFYVGRLTEFFFLLSGYLTYPHVHKIRTTDVSFKDFYLKRALRLLPMVAISVFFLQLNFCFYYLLYDGAAFGTIEHVGDAVSLWRFIVAALGIDSGWMVKADIGYTTWYISVLMLCYAVFWLITFLSKRLRVSPYYMYAFMIAVAITINTWNLDLPFLNLSAARGYGAFFFGIIFARYMNEGKIRNWMKAGSVLAVLAIVFSYFFTFARSIIVRYGFEEAYILTFVLYPAIMIILDFPFIRKICDFKVLGVLGRCSYDVYIWHVPMLVFFYNLLKAANISLEVSSLPCMAGFTLAMWIIGILSYYFIEKKIRGLLSAKWELK
ncbi:MAG: acyltransferase [Roseburia sp.]|nr:acyltransferase [Ruminococcus sp.]MCM1156386.1 acyltransferase [Roseburia sp.]MCM1242294.1 acyltransferase [Roseburia sp.]